MCQECPGRPKLINYKIQVLTLLVQVTNTRAQKLLIQRSSFQFHEIFPLPPFRSHPNQENGWWRKCRISVVSLSQALYYWVERTLVPDFSIPHSCQQHKIRPSSNSQAHQTNRKSCKSSTKNNRILFIFIKQSLAILSRFLYPFISTPLFVFSELFEAYQNFRHRDTSVYIS